MAGRYADQCLRAMARNRLGGHFPGDGKGLNGGPVTRVRSVSPRRTPWLVRNSVGMSNVPFHCSRRSLATTQPASILVFSRPSN
ncbi:hypothetical protein UG55_1007261 [Frankia sp. EI5c]|nr:hypothetical protein UG55_1007261 [Frankia sp. EI5c]